MSTKTSIKRIALVAVAALGLGFISVAPSSAQDQSSISIVSSDSTGTVGTAACATVFHTAVTATGQYLDEMNAGAMLWASPSTSAKTTANSFTWSIPDTTTAVNTNGLLTSASNAIQSWSKSTWVAQYLHTAAGRTSAYLKLCMTPDAAGTYTVRIYGFPNGTVDAIYTDWTFTVTAPTPTVASSTAYVREPKEDGTSYTSASDYTAAKDATGYLLASKASGNLAGSIYVTQSNGSTSNPLIEDNASKLTATVSGSGLVSIVPVGSTCVATAGVRAVTTDSKKISNKICFFSDGTAGKGTVTWSAGTTVLGSTSATFYGAAAAYKAVVVQSVIQKTSTITAPSPTTVSNANRKAVKVLVTDANGNPVYGAKVFMNSSDTTIISGTYQADKYAGSDSDGYAYFDLTGNALGTAKLSFTSKRFANDPLITTSNPELTAGPVEVRVGDSSPASVKIAFDKDSYLPGEKATVSVTLLDSKGNVVPRGVYSIFSAALSSNYALSAGSTPGTAVTTATCVNGTTGLPVASAADCGSGNVQISPVLTAGQVWISGSTGATTYSVNMPTTAGTVTLSGTVSAYLTDSTGASAAIAGTAVSASAVVEDQNAAAIDAANEATDAANAATDAANAAAEAADAATAAAQDAQAAVAALATSVASLIAGIKAQITSLTNLVIKIQKKVKA